LYSSFCDSSGNNGFGAFVDFSVQHMMYGFGDEQNVSRYPLHYYFVAI
jgi:hypothetical protein